MRQGIILLSGRIGSGKTTLSNLLAHRFQAEVRRTKLLIDEISGSTSGSRDERTHKGDQLDEETNHGWIAEYIRNQPLNSDLLVVDSIRFAQQARAVRLDAGSAVIHVHLEAPLGVLENRYTAKMKQRGVTSYPIYDSLEPDRSEEQLKDLAREADLVVNTTQLTEHDVLTKVAAQLGLYGHPAERLVDVLVGGQFGSEGKGHIASYLAREYDVLIRVGGPNAGHTVFERGGKYVHHQLPSGTRRGRADLMIGAGAVIDPVKLMVEINECGVTPERLFIDPQAMVIEESDKVAEAQLKREISSTAQGVGHATMRRISRLAEQKVRLAKSVPELRPYIRDVAEQLEKAYWHNKLVMLEGTQGTRLSLFHGIYPYVTSRDTTVAGAMAEAGVPASKIRRTIVVCRPYPIRVGNPDGGGTSGPMGGREINWQIVSDRSGVPVEQLIKDEVTSTTKRDRRVAEFDWEEFRKAVTLNGPSDIALTFCDYISRSNENAYRFEQLTEGTIRFIEDMEKVSGAPVSLISTRFGDRSIIDRRAW
jgi:adenylosuccinate synthase